MKSVILDYAVERREEIQAVYQYDFSESLNIISIDDRKIAFIDSTYKDISRGNKIGKHNHQPTRDFIISAGVFLKHTFLHFQLL